MLERLPLAGFVLLLPWPIAAQNAAPGEERPLVEEIRFMGVRALDEGELRESIVTEETRCRGTFLLRPLCWLTDWSAVVDHNHLRRSELPRDELRLEVVYFRKGYRRAVVASEVQPEGDGVAVIFHVEEGEPTRVAFREVRQTRPVLSEEDIRRALLPREGERLDLNRLEAGISQLNRVLGEQGYLDSEIADSIELAPDWNTARVLVEIRPRRRATVAELEIRGNEAVSDGTIADALRIGPGSVLRNRDIAASQRSLYESNLFHEARVELPPQEDSAKTVVISVREAPPRAARIGGGFNTSEFLQTEARFTHYNWLGGGRRLDIRATLGNLLAEQLNGQGIFRDVLPPATTAAEAAPFLRPTWRGSADFLQPSFRAAENTLGSSVFAQRRIIPGVVIDEGAGAEVSITRRLDYRVSLSLDYRLEETRVEAGDLYFCSHHGICDRPSIVALRGRHMLSPISVSFSADRADQPLSPSSGYRARLDLEHASSITVSDFRYNRVSGEVSGYRPFGLHRNRVLAGRLRAGWVGALAGTGAAVGVPSGPEGRDALLHPRKRFYAGGSRSVRGFRENQLGPRILTVAPEALTEGEDAPCTEADIVDQTCDPTGVDLEHFVSRPLGGRAVLEGSVEYRFPLWRAFDGAVFLDGAVVAERLDGFFSHGTRALTPGFGFRYRSPIAPIRVDLGIRPTLTEYLPVVTEVQDEDGQRRLVHLLTPRLYDPVAAAGGGFFRQVLGRLRLHLSIGEAY